MAKARARFRVLRGIKIGLAGLFLLTLIGFVVGALSTNEGNAGGAVTTGLLWLYLGTSIILPLSVLSHAGYWIVDSVRGDRETDWSTKGVVSSVLRAVELVLAVVVLIVEASLGELLSTQPGGEGAGSIVLGAGLLVTLLGSCLAVTVLAGGLVDDIRFRTA